MSCDVGEVMERLENELCYDYNYELCSFTKPFRRFTYVTAHSPILPSLYLGHNSFCNSSVASPTSQLILQPFFRFSYVTGSSLTSPGEPPMHIYVSYKIFAKYCADTDKNKALIDCHKCSSSFLSIVKSHRLKIPASVLEKVRSGSCLKLFLIECRCKYSTTQNCFIIITLKLFNFRELSFREMLKTSPIYMYIMYSGNLIVHIISMSTA